MLQVKSQEYKSDEYNQELIIHRKMVEDFVSTLRFCYFDTARDIESSPRHFFLKIIDDFIQSIISIRLLAEQGIINQCRRECRYLLETAVKSCIIVQKNSELDYEQQILSYSKLLRDTNINQVKNLSLYLIPSLELAFVSETQRMETQRMYGRLNNYVHCTPSQLEEKLELAKQGKYIGYSGISELKELNGDLEQVLSLIIVLLLHSLPKYVVGDLLVESDGSSNSFHFMQSKYVSEIDSCFDYKYERQNRIELIKSFRANRLKF